MHEKTKEALQESFQIEDLSHSTLQESSHADLNTIKKSEDTVEHEVIKSTEHEESKVQISQNETDTSTELFPSSGSFIEHLTGGNLLVRIGGVVLFFGLAFLVKYAAEQGILDLKMRLWGVAIIGVMLAALGWRLRKKEGAYGQILQGIGIATIYLVIYASSKFYGLLDLRFAFVLMFAVVVVASVLAVLQNALPLALFTSAGGFMVPILTSDAQGHHVALFSYYSFLNLGIFIVAWYRSWRVLNLLGFVFTFGVATVWGVLRYRPEMFATTEPFLILFFVMYLSISILFTLKYPYDPKHPIDGTLVFGLPMVAFVLQLHLVDRFDYGDAYSAVFLGALYTLLYILFRRKKELLLLAYSFLALSTIFFTIAVPYIFDADVSAALWSIEAVAILWISLKQHSVIGRYFAILLLLLSAVVYPVYVGHYDITNVEYLGYLIVIASTMTAAWLLDAYNQSQKYTTNLIYTLLLFSLVLWFASTPSMLQYFEDDNLALASVIGAIICIAVAQTAKWQLLQRLLQGFLPFAVVLFYVPKVAGYYPIHPFYLYGFWVFVSLVAVNYLLLRLYDAKWRFAHILHVVSLWFVVSVFSFELHYHAVQMQSYIDTITISWAAAPLIFGAAILLFYRHLGRYKQSYRDIALGLIILYLSFWELFAFAVPALDHSFAYVPIINPIDAMQILVVVLAGYWLHKQHLIVSKSTLMRLYAVLSLFGWLLLTVIFARFVYNTQDLEYFTPESLWYSSYFQTGISILWSILAIASMLISKKYKQRIFWLGGFGLLLLVVLKLFFVELAHSGTVERIISFVVVGLLLLLIGYFVPIPPGSSELDINDKKSS